MPLARSSRVSIIIVSFNTKQMTLECIRSVFEQTSSTPFEIIVVDNASEDGSADAIAEEFKDRIKLIRADENLGFARANNEAARLAVGRYLLLLNPDTIVIDRAIDKLFHFAATRPTAQIWGGRTIFADGSPNLASCWARQSFRSLMSQATGLSSVFRRSSFFNIEGMGGWDRQTEREVDIVSGCYLMILRELWIKLDGFDPCFFMYGEEADLCLRARQHGARPRIDPESLIVHYGGASETEHAGKLVRLLWAKQQLILRHFPPRTQPIAAALLAIWPLSRYIGTKTISLLQLQSANSKTEVWQEVWRRKPEWRTNNK